MYFKSKKISLLLLGITSLACSRVMFLLFSDPEGPNLLVVTVMAAIIYFSSLTVYVLNPLLVCKLKHPSLTQLTGLKRLLVAVSIQIILAVFFFFYLR